MILTYNVGVQTPGNLWWEIQTYLNVYEPTFIADIPTFVQAAEERVYNSVQHSAWRKNQSGTMTLGNKYLTLPADWLATYSITLTDPTTLAQTFLLNKDVNFIREAYPTPNYSSTPQYYAQFDWDTLILGPTPDKNYGVELHYYYYPASITSSGDADYAAGTSWLGQNFAEVLLHGSIREALVYTKGEADIIAAYEAKYMEGMTLLKRLADGMDRRDAYRSGQTRTAVP